MSIKSFADFEIEGTICQFIKTVELSEAVSQGYELRCILKPSADFPGTFVAEVWGCDPDTQQDEAQGILAVFPDEAFGGDIRVLNGDTFAKLKASMRGALDAAIYDRLIIDEAPTAAPVSCSTKEKIVLDLAGQSGVAH